MSLVVSHAGFARHSLSRMVRKSQVASAGRGSLSKRPLRRGAVGTAAKPSCRAADPTNPADYLFLQMLGYTESRFELEARTPMRFSICLFVAMVGVFFFSSARAEAPGSATQVTDFEVVQLQSPALATRPEGEIVMTLEGWGEQFRLILQDNERLLERLPNASRRAIGAGGNRFLSGRLEGKPGSWVRMNWIGGQFDGAFFDGDTLYLMDTPRGFATPGGRAVDASGTMLMRFSDLQLDGLFDHGGVDAGQASRPIQNYKDYVADLREYVEVAGLSLLAMPVTIVTDTFWEDEFGVDAEAKAIGRLNSVDGIFSSQLGVGIVLWHYEQLDDNGPLTSTESGELLSDQFLPFMNTGAGSDIPFKGLAHLFTGRDLDGNTVGRAYLNVLCNTVFGLGINQNLSNNTTSFLVFAHELGHNFSANHVDEGIMRATLGGSQEFSAESLDVMSAAVAGANCLVDGGLQLFKDGFE